MENQNQVNWIVVVLLMIISFMIGGAIVYFMMLSNLKNESESTKVPVSQTGAQNNLANTDGQKLPESCTDADLSISYGTPTITSINTYTGRVGDKIELKGCNFIGFESDKILWIENSQGIKGVLYGERDSDNHSVKVTLKSPLCQEDNSYSGLDCKNYLNLTPGVYKISSRDSNKVLFTVTQ